jgi:hypothetical protein
MLKTRCSLYKHSASKRFFFSCTTDLIDLALQSVQPQYRTKYQMDGKNSLSKKSPIDGGLYWEHLQSYPPNLILIKHQIECLGDAARCRRFWGTSVSSRIPQTRPQKMYIIYNKSFPFKLDYISQLLTKTARWSPLVSRGRWKRRWRCLAVTGGAHHWVGGS